LVNLSPGSHAQYQEDKKGENANQEADHKERERSLTCKGLVKQNDHNQQLNHSAPVAKQHDAFQRQFGG